MEHGPDSLELPEAAEDIVQVREPCAIPQYSCIGTEIRRKQSSGTQKYNNINDPKNIAFFENGGLAIDPHKLPFKLFRWNGLIEDYQFPPSWEPQPSNLAAIYMQMQIASHVSSVRRSNSGAMGIESTLIGSADRAGIPG